MHEMIIHQFMEEKNMSILKALVQLQAKEDTAPIPEGSSAGQKNRRLDRDSRGISCSTMTISLAIQHTMI
jgi:hypothetical protein